MTRDLVDSLQLDRRGEGTTAVVTHRLSRPARLLTSCEILAGAQPSTAPHRSPTNTSRW